MCVRTQETCREGLLFLAMGSGDRLSLLRLERASDEEGVGFEGPGGWAVQMLHRTGDVCCLGTFVVVGMPVGGWFVPSW